MATATRKCKVCGVEYEYCHTARRTAGVFRWQDVACSPEHGSIYLERILASRSAKETSDGAETDTETEEVISTVERADSLDDTGEDEEDELFEEDFDDSEEEPVIET